MFCHWDISIFPSSYLVSNYAGFGLSCEESWIAVLIDLELELI